MIIKKKKTVWIVLLSIIGFFLLLVVLNGWHDDYREWRILRKSIVWSPNRSLQLSDFKYEPDKIQMDNVAVTVGMVSVHKMRFGKLEHRSTTVFIPQESFITKLDDTLVLRIAQARFDFCELYRRKMEIEINALEIDTIKNISKTIKEYGQLYHDLFEEQWDRFNAVDSSELSKGLKIMEDYLAGELK